MTQYDSDCKLTVALDARPNPINFPLSQSAVLVIDMQNDFGSKGGLFDRAGIDIAGIRAVVPSTARVLASARAAGMPVVYVNYGLRPDLLDLFAPDSPLRNRFLSYGIGTPSKSADGRDGRIAIRDTWNTDVIDELKPEPGNPTVYKHGYSAFHQTELDVVLRGLGVKYLIVTGCTTSVCVETAIREAHARDYSCILIEDCTAEPIGHGAKGYIGVPGSVASSGGANYDATLVLIQSLFGWVSNSESVAKALEVKQAVAIQA